MASAETTVKESSSLHDATCSDALSFYSSIYLCLYRFQYCSYFPFTKHFHVWHLSVSWFLSHLFGFFITFSSPFLAFNPLLAKFLFSVHYLDALIHFHGLKYHLCADSSQICICETACSSKLQSPTSNCLLYISIWMSHRCLKFNIFKIEIFHYSSLYSLPYHISLPLNLAQLNKWNYLCSFAQEKK